MSEAVNYQVHAPLRITRIVILTDSLSQVDRFEYRPLSQPFTLLTIEPSDLLPPAGGASCSATNSEVPAAAPPVEGDAALGAAAQPKEAAAAASAGAAAATAAARRSRHIVQVTAAGRLDAVVWWMEYEMAPNCRLSFAPQGLGVRGALCASCRRLCMQFGEVYMLYRSKAACMHFLR